MASPTLLLNLDTGQSNEALLTVASLLAKRLGASVIGVTARQPVQLAMTGVCDVAPDVTDVERLETEAEVAAAEAEFRGAFPDQDVEWRSTIAFGALSTYVVDQARHADLLLTGMPVGKTVWDRATPGELVMQCGRPVLVVPPAMETASLDRVMLAWRDTREARRAALDALPLLKRAAHVAVVEIAADDGIREARQRVGDVSRWLAAHGVVAEPVAAVSRQDDAAQLESLARGLDADLVVAGAYGHSRLREWAFGGVTRSLLRPSRRCALLSH